MRKIIAFEIALSLVAASAEVAPPTAAHALGTRRFEGVPSIAVSERSGRMWCTWYGGPTAGEDSNNYAVLATSADGGITWKEVLVADPDGAGPVRAFDPEVWLAPDGRLRWTWTERVAPLAANSKNRYAGAMASAKDDKLMMLELDADSEPAGACVPRQIGRGVMMGKPTVLKDGTWLFPIAHWFESPSACVYATTDSGRTFTERGGVALPKDKRCFDEHQIVELQDGTLRCYMRTIKGPDGIWEAESKDQGRTWGAPHPSRVQNTSARFFVRRLASGNLLLVKNGRHCKDEGRRNLTAYLSLDDGKTWPYSLPLDEECDGVSYPDGQQLPDGRILVAYDHDRVGAREILLATFREDDVRYGRHVSSDLRRLQPIHRGDTWEWHDGSALPQEGRGFSDTATPYVRIPDRLRKNCPEAVWGLSRNSSGICYRFITDSRQLRVKWSVRDVSLSSHNMTGAGRSGVDVYGWDEKSRTWRFAHGSRPKQTDSELSFHWAPGRPCMIYLPLYNEVTRFEVGVLKGSKIAPLPTRASGVSKPVVCYGTSITHGASASRPGLSWTAQAARLADVPFVNLGFAGSGKMEESMLDVVAEIDASLYVLDCLWNMTPKMVEERFEPFVRELHRRRPTTPILCAEDCSTFRDRTEKGLMAEKVIAKLKAENPVEWKNLHFIPNTEQMARDGEETVDGTHPNDCGMRQMGIGFGNRYKLILGLK